MTGVYVLEEKRPGVVEDDADGIQNEIESKRFVPSAHDPQYQKAPINYAH